MHVSHVRHTELESPLIGVIYLRQEVAIVAHGIRQRFLGLTLRCACSSQPMRGARRSMASCARSNRLPPAPAGWGSASSSSRRTAFPRLRCRLIRACDAPCPARARLHAGSSAPIPTRSTSRPKGRSGTWCDAIAASIAARSRPATPRDFPNTFRRGSRCRNPGASL
jgi:hypothetical protein